MNISGVLFLTLILALRHDDFSTAEVT